MMVCMRTGTQTARLSKALRLRSKVEITNVLCKRFRVLFFIPYQVSGCEKLGKEVSQNLTEYLAEDRVYISIFCCPHP